MKAWRLIRPKVLEMQTSEAVKLDDPSKIKVKIEKADICATDFHLYQGLHTVRYPFILGRHGVGVISDVYDEKSPYKKGDPVVINPYVPCDNCLFCKSGEHELCSDLGILGVNEDGLYRDFVTLDEKNIYRIPENLSFESALFTEYVALALSVLDRLDVQKGEHVAVLSAGKMGLIVAQLLAYYQAVPVIIDADNEMLEQAKELGFYYGCNSNNDPESYVFSITGGRMWCTLPPRARTLIWQWTFARLTAGFALWAFCLPLPWAIFPK